MEFTISIVDLINILIITIGIGVCGMCFLHITTSESLKQEKVFRRYFQLIFIFLTLTITAHLVRLVLDGQPGQEMHLFLTIIPCLEGIFVSTVPYMMALLLLSITRSKYKTRIEIGLHIVLFLQVTFSIYSGIRGLSYFFDEQNIYHRGPLYLLANLGPALLIVVCMVLLFCYRRRIGTLVKIAFWIFVTSPLIAMVVQSFSYDVQYIILVIIASSVFMYFAILKQQSDQYKKQKDAIEKLQNGLILVLADLVESRDKCTGDHIKKTANYVSIIIEL